MEPALYLLGLLPFEWAAYGFMQKALLATLLIAPAFALLGCLVISNQMAFFSEAVGHATLTGIALGVFLGVSDPSFSMTLFAVLLALMVTYLRKHSAVSVDTLIGIVMAFTVALGVVLLSRGGNFAKYSRFLVGDILTVSTGELWRLSLMLAILGLFWLFFFNRFLITFLNHSLAQSRGINIWATEALFSSAVALVVAASIPWVGLLVVNSLIIIPAAAARNLAENTRQYALFAVASSLTSGVVGLVLSYYWGTATGATMVLAAIAIYVLSLARRLPEHLGL